MLANEKLKAFIPVRDVERSRQFYENVLGLTVVSSDKYAIQYDSGGVLLRTVPVGEFTPHTFTALGWNVKDIVYVVTTLQQKGVIFEKYSFLEQDEWNVWTTPDGSKVAWFKDPDGNVLSLSQINGE